MKECHEECDDRRFLTRRGEKMRGGEVVIDPDINLDNERSRSGIRSSR